MVIKPLRLELRKQVPSSAFWILVLLHGFVVVLVSTNLNAFLNNAGMALNDAPEVDFSLSPVLQFPDVWQNLTYIASYFKIILAIVVIISVSNEFGGGTARQNIIDGLSRKQWLYTKIGLAKLLAFYSTILVIIMCLVVGFSQEGQVEFSGIFTRMEFVLAYFFELLTYFIYALFLAIVLKRTGLTIILLLVYDFIFEPIISWSLPEKVKPFLPMNAIDNLNTFPFIRYVDGSEPLNLSGEQLIWTVAYGIIFAIFSYLLLNRKDL